MTPPWMWRQTPGANMLEMLILYEFFLWKNKTVATDLHDSLRKSGAFQREIEQRVASGREPTLNLNPTTPSTQSLPLTSPASPATALASRPPPMADANMSAIMATVARLEKEKEGDIKPVSRSLKNDYKKTKNGEKKGKLTCPGIIRCKKETCNHENARYSADDKVTIKGATALVGGVLAKCEEDGYPVTNEYALPWVRRYCTSVDLAVGAIKADLNKREGSLKANGRVCYKREIDLAEASTATDARDMHIEYMEKDDARFLDFDRNGWSSAFGRRCQEFTNKTVQDQWFLAYTYESKYRQHRQMIYRGLQKWVKKGEMSQQDMDGWLDKYDMLDGQGETEIGVLERLKVADESNWPPTLLKVAPASSPSASSCMSSSATPKTEISDKIASVQTTRQDIIRAAAPPTPSGEKVKRKAKGKSKEAGVKDNAQQNPNVEGISKDKTAAEIPQASSSTARDLGDTTKPELHSRDKIEEAMGIEGSGGKGSSVVEDRMSMLRALLNNLSARSLEVSINNLDGGDQTIKIDVYMDGHKKTAKPRKCSESLFKTMAKANVEGKRREISMQDADCGNDLPTNEMAARGLSGYGGALKAAMAAKAAAYDAGREIVTEGPAKAEAKLVAKGDDKKATGGVAKDSSGGTASNKATGVPIKLHEDGLWPPVAANSGHPRVWSSLSHSDEDFRQLHQCLISRQRDIVGGISMVEDGLYDPGSIEYIKEVTNINCDKMASLYIGLGGTSAALGAHLYKQVEMEVGKYFGKQEVAPEPADCENEAARFALWMYRVRDQARASQENADNDDLYD